MVSRIYCNYESTNFSRNLVCLFLCTVIVYKNIHFHCKIRRFVVTEFVKLLDELDNKLISII